MIITAVCHILRRKKKKMSRSSPELHTSQQREMAAASSCRFHSVKPLPVRRPRGTYGSGGLCMCVCVCMCVRVGFRAKLGADFGHRMQ